MGQKITLKASDGFTLDAYRADPAGKAKGGIVLIQEIFGVNQHIRALVDEWAKAGYAVIAPACYDRAEKNFEVGYDEEARQKGMAARAKLDGAKTVLDYQAAHAALSGVGKIAIMGYCYGGTVAWQGAQTGPFDAAVCYYGGAIAKLLHLTNTCPVMQHNGTADPWIPPDDEAAMDAAHKPNMIIHKYPGIGHAFVNDTLPHRYHAETAKIARGRTMAFFAKHLR